MTQRVFGVCVSFLSIFFLFFFFNTTKPLISLWGHGNGLDNGSQLGRNPGPRHRHGLLGRVPLLPDWPLDAALIVFP